MRSPIDPRLWRTVLRMTLVGLLWSVVTISATGPYHFTPALQTPGGTPSADVGFYPPKWVVDQGGFFLLILVMWYGYRRDFLTKIAGLEEKLKAEREERAEEKAEFKAILREVAASQHAQAIALARNTDAMTVNTQSNKEVVLEMRKLSERRIGERGPD